MAPVHASELGKPLLQSVNPLLYSGLVIISVSRFAMSQPIRHLDAMNRQKTEDRIIAKE